MPGRSSTLEATGICYAIQTHVKRNLSYWKRIAGPCTVMSKAGSVNPLLCSRVVSCLSCSEFSESPEDSEGPDTGSLRAARASGARACSCVFWRDDVRLPLTIITIMHCVSVPMPALTACWAPCCAPSHSVSTQCQLQQLVSTRINSESSSS